jgi:hypothetical protein
MANAVVLRNDEVLPMMIESDQDIQPSSTL